MRTYFYFISVQFVLVCLPLFTMVQNAGGQAAGQMGSATPSHQAGETMKDAPSGILDLSDLGAKITFLVFLGIFFTLYMLIRRKPTEKEWKKKHKKKP